MDALDLLSAHLLRFGDRVAVEHPSFPPLLDLLEAAGAQIVAVDVDATAPVPTSSSERSRPERGRSSCSRARRTRPAPRWPSSARPSWLRCSGGMTRWSSRTTRPARSRRAPLVSLGAWLPERCAHIRSFSKSHGPDLRLAAVGGAASLVRPVVERRHLGQGWTSRLLQRLLLDLLTEPASMAQVEAARVEYARRRCALTGELAGSGSTSATATASTSGCRSADEASALVALASRGIGAAPGCPVRRASRDGGPPAGDRRPAGRRATTRSPAWPRRSRPPPAATWQRPALNPGTPRVRPEAEPRSI